MCASFLLARGVVRGDVFFDVGGILSGVLGLSAGGGTKSTGLGFPDRFPPLSIPCAASAPSEEPLFVTIALLITLAAPQVRYAKPASHTPTEADSIRRTIEKDRDDTREWLKSGATSYLATAMRVEFDTRAALKVGRRHSSDVHLDDPAVRDDHLLVTVVGDSFRVEALDDSATFKVKGVTQRTVMVGPSAIGVGRYSLRLSHQRYPAIIVFDPENPRYKTYKGIDYFPVDLSWRYVLPLTPDPVRDTVVIQSTRGSQRRAVRAGWFDFIVGRTRCRLEANRLLEPGVGEHDIAVFFRDATTGKETYPVGRYLDPTPLPDGRYVLDFNMAYNPACAYSDHYNCPIPSSANRLKVAVRAGEQDMHYLELKQKP
jgi:uncharacterized protein